MKKLNIRGTEKVTDEGIKNMILVEWLDLHDNKIITDQGIKNMNKM